MKQFRWIAASAAALLPSVSAAPANDPHGYTPQIVACPSVTPTIRSASELSQNERNWTDLRRNATIEPMRDFLSRMNITGIDTDAYIDGFANNASLLPNIGIAISGGGYRAMLNGAGVLQAFDNRTPNATATGQLGGLLQAATYLSGLSGGSWLVSTLYGNNWTSVADIIAAGNSSGRSGVWRLANTIFEGPQGDGLHLLDSIGYYATLGDAVHGKEAAGFNTTITDYWGRALSYQMINAMDGGPAYTFSSIAEQEWFRRGDAPLPLITIDSRKPGETLVSTNSTVFTVSPWEIGSDDPTLYAFAPLQYSGTNFSAGSPKNDERCVVGFDNIGYVFGTSSSLFNAILTTVNGTNTTGWTSSVLQGAITSILSAIGKDEEDIASWPNPFVDYDKDTNFNNNEIDLHLVDGGEDGQNIPLHPLIQPNRNVDVIFAVDSSADTNDSFPTTDSAPGWPDGISIITTYQRSLSDIGNGTAFPKIPSLNTFMNLGLNTKPVFFGCDASQLAGPAPLVVYMPNAPYVYTSNTSTFQMEYNDTERNAIVLNGHNMATLGNGTVDGQWPQCVGCAVLSRSLNRTKTKVPDVCTQCFVRYCWNGTEDDSTPGRYNPIEVLTAGDDCDWG
ncbi:uncharacterized protein MYCFIDRAFT_201016 [Pseudocercospora fijiensis CIRAD86]|uniref:Lysophospholipase n=1 Tax=Pseudocercospora fijiensis (strain CIRAD86) TaxID=383855 RepID=N1Q5J2_PSEFD|nr:uncharacterized protein MYCFIDRAFT_201016 [Pseudocercospora fijiensis CIRAD86]EME87150.1 hypothetical protein MYCFIDRAFT_201016 [Pseudocercospora fijiensis CIRAD86]